MISTSACGPPADFAAIAVAHANEDAEQESQFHRPRSFDEDPDMTRAAEQVRRPDDHAQR